MWMPAETDLDLETLRDLEGDPCLDFYGSLRRDEIVVDSIKIRTAIAWLGVGRYDGVLMRLFVSEIDITH